MRFPRMKAKEVAALLMQHPERYVLVEDPDLCLVAHDRIHLDVVNHSRHGTCISISAIATNKGKNFTYQADAEPAPTEFQITS